MRAKANKTLSPGKGRWLKRITAGAVSAALAISSGLPVMASGSESAAENAKTITSIEVTDGAKDLKAGSVSATDNGGTISVTAAGMGTIVMSKLDGSKQTVTSDTVPGQAFGLAEDSFSANPDEEVTIKVKADAGYDVDRVSLTKTDGTQQRADGP